MELNRVVYQTELVSSTKPKDLEWVQVILA